MSKIGILSFNSGELSPKIDVRIDVEKYASGCRRLENMIPTKYGGAERLPGKKFIAASYGGASIVRMIDFVYSASVVYKIEMGQYYFRIYYADEVLTDESDNEVVVVAPYAAADLFQIQYRQIGDVMWLVHPSYKPRKLSRTSAYEFTLEVIPFRNGPFLTRNDLVDPTIANPTTIRCTATQAGQYGSLLASSEIFLAEHEGALFKLSHARTLKSATLTGNGGTVATAAFSGKGTYNLITRGTWTGSIVWQRRENGGDWEELFKYSSSSDAHQNINKSHVEKSDSNEHRLYTEDGSSKLRADFSIDEPLESGVVKILSVVNSLNATVEVYSKIASTAATKKWYEGSWSGVRGYPAAIGFFEDRCVYAGASSGSAGDQEEQAYYPDLINLYY